MGIYELNGNHINVKFNESYSRTNLKSGENIATSLGKVKKYFNDLGDAAFDDVDNTPIENSTNLVTSGGVYNVLGTTHNNLFRGKYLGNTYTDIQKASVVAGTFDDLYVGDYWTIGGINWRIADIDYYFNFGDTTTTSHHLVIVPDNTLYDAKMNNTNTTAGGYSGSVMRTDNLESAKTTINNSFGSTNILTYRDLLCNAVDTTDVGDVPATGLPTGWAWTNCTVELMSEQQISGTTSWSTAQQNGYDVGISYSQFALFRYNRQFINKTRKWFWLRSVRSASSFCLVSGNGALGGSTASSSGGVRPLFLLS